MSHMLRSSTIFGLLIVWITVLFFTVGVKAEIPSRPQITEQDFKKLFKEGQLIKERTIPAYFVADALSTTLTPQDQLTHSDALWISDCTIEGTLNLSEKKVAISGDFTDVVFNGDVYFDGTAFENSLNFSGETRFTGKVSFSMAKFKHLTCEGGVLFDQQLESRGAIFQEQTILNATFNRGAVFEKAEFHNLTDFSNAIFKDMKTLDLSRLTSFDEAQFHDLAIFEGVVFGGDTRFVRTVFDGDASFYGAQFQREAAFNRAQFKHESWFNNVQFLGSKGDFGGASFSGDADFSGAQFRQLADFSYTIFGGEVDFYQTEFPKLENITFHKFQRNVSGVMFDSTRFDKRVRLDFDQLMEKPAWWRVWQSPTPKLTVYDQRPWENLEQTFKRADNLQGQNEAHYQRQLLSASAPEISALNLSFNRFNRIFWGYGVRPARLMGWILLTYLVFTFIYWTQTKSLAAEPLWWQGQKRRLKFALDFSLRTSLKSSYGYDNSRTDLFRKITRAHSLVIKVMLFFWLVALSNVLPLISDLVKKLLPV